MLTHLHIRDFAIIDDTEAEPGKGLTSLTGETGAGKSILLDALGLALGARSTSESVREGATRAEISASFDIDSLPRVGDWLREQALDGDGDCILRRVVTTNGKSRATINGRPVAARSLADLGAMLVSIHGQSAHQTLSSSSEQRRLLDRWKPFKDRLRLEAAFDAWQAAEQRLFALNDQSTSRQQRLDLISFQLQEFDELEIGTASLDEIESEHRWLANAERLKTLGEQAREQLDDVAGPALVAATRPLEEFVKLDDRLREALDLVESAGIQITEAASLLSHRTSALEGDDARLAWLDERLAVLHRLAKKHRVQPDELAGVEQALRDELDTLTDPGETLEALEAEVAAKCSAWLELAAAQSKHRARTAKALGRIVTESMQTLAMTGGVFRIDVQSDSTRRERHGIDRIVFETSPNPGVSPAPLAKIASGGELSRISLCLQLATIGVERVPTLIFDEVDAGIGGAVAETVGRLLREVGEHAQVLCVTHLAQVAARAHHHLRVVKSVEKGRTRTRLDALDADGTREEIARMLGGRNITRKSRQHAQEMLDDVGS